MRRAREAPEAPSSARVNEGWHSEVRRYRFLTPVFGGGVSVDGSKKPYDERTPVRSASVRGQLRFWWRACNPRGCKTLAELREQEQQIFGGVRGSKPIESALQIDVVGPSGRPRELEVFDRSSKFKVANGKPEGLAYGAFPLRQSEGTAPFAHGTLWDFGSAEFSVRIRYPKVDPSDTKKTFTDDIEAALWAWAHFGGLGGRTRRGFGSIAQLTKGLLSIDEGCARYLGTGGVGLWPRLVGRESIVLTSKEPGRQAIDDGIKCQSFLLTHLQRLRQVALGRSDKSDREPKRPGRSYWPEPDAIRAMFKGEVRGRHAKARVDNVVKKFPRWRFGMPIIFEFKTEEGEREPARRQLVPLGKGRLASSLILRPHLEPGESKLRAMAVVLDHPEPKGLALSLSRESSTEVRAELWLKPEEARYPNSPLVREGRAYIDPIQRYLEEIR